MHVQINKTEGHSTKAVQEQSMNNPKKEKKNLQHFKDLDGIIGVLCV